MTNNVSSRLRPAVVRPGARVAVVSPSSPIDRAELDRGLDGLRALGFEPVWDEDTLAKDGYVAGPASSRAAAFLRAWEDPTVSALVASRGGYGSAQILPWLDPARLRATPKLFIGYSDTTAILTWLTVHCGLTALHGPMIERRIAALDAGVHVESLRAALAGGAAGRLMAPASVEVLQLGEAEGLLLGGTVALLCASLGTPYAFMPPAGSVLFLEDVQERPFRLDRMLTQLRLAGVFDRASAVVFGDMPGCDDAGGLTAREVAACVLRDFRGPVLWGFPSGHTTGPLWTLPLGVRVRVVTGATPGVIVDEEAVV